MPCLPHRIGYYGICGPKEKAGGICIRVKICGITRPADARLAESSGADAIGVVLFSDSPRSVTLAQASAVFASAGPLISRVAVSHTRSPEDLESILSLSPTAVQLSANLPVPHGIKCIRVVQPGDPIPAEADAIVIDGSRGQGIPYDPQYARSVVQSSPVPVILAGGLNPGNVQQAIRDVRPYAVDVATGVQARPGMLDPDKLDAFIVACGRGR